MTSQRVEKTWISTGGYGRFRGEWVNKDFFYKKMYGHFARRLKKWLNNKVAVRWGFTVLFYTMKMGMLLM